MKIHSFLSKKCSIKKSATGGLGVYANKSFKKDELVALWGGVIYSAEEVDKLSKEHPNFATHTVSIYKNFYLGPINLRKSLDDAECFNHSCDPNIGIKGQIVLVARRKIKAGEELCFDYDTTETSKEGWFYCECGTKNCRKKIDGSASKDENFLKKNKDYLSWYILNSKRG